MMKIATLIPTRTLREGVIATEKGTTEKGYLYEPGDIITGKYVIDRRSYDSDYTEQSNTDGNVTFIKTKKMNAVTIKDLIDNIDEFNSNVSESWVKNSVIAKGIEFPGKVATVNGDGKLVLVTSERVSEVPEDVVILFNTDDDGKYFNVYYCQVEKLPKLYENASDIL